MSQQVIVVGDKTSHGGVVISGAPATTIDGKPMARIGDKATCPCRGHGSVTLIVSGDPTCIIDGQPIARHGDKTACGATLISSQVRVTDGGSGGNGGNSSVPGAANGSTSGPGHSASASNAAAAVFAYDEQVKLAISAGLATLVGLPWFIKTADGRTFKGRLDSNGQLPRVDTPAEDQYETFWGDEALEMAGGSV
jgi:uncharacterized Zn-binding protein involved in type VI secretion